jgi:hypothetical protein
MMPIITIALGVFIYWFNFGWTMVNGASMAFIFSSTLVVVGLISFLKTIQSRNS